MKKISTVLLSSIVLFSSCKKETIRGSGAIVSEDRNVPAIIAVQINGDGEANIVYGATQQVTVTGYQNLLPVYETKLVGTTLHLQFKSSLYRIRNNNIKVNIVAPVLSWVRTNGSGDITVKNFVNGNILSASTNGSGNIFIQDSKYNKATYTVNGSGNITANTTLAADAEAEIHGSGNIRLNVTNSLNARISGSGNIDYWGNPATANTQVSGSGRINKK